MSVSAEEREAILEGLWEEGGFKFLWGGFSDLLRDPEANEIASEYIRNKIRETVEGSAHRRAALSRRAIPTGPSARRSTPTTTRRSTATT